MFRPGSSAEDLIEFIHKNVRGSKDAINPPATADATDRLADKKMQEPVS